MTPGRLKDKRVLVTGGATGLGRAICLRLGREGARVIVNYRTHQQEAATLKAELESLGAACSLLQADVRDAKQVAALLESVGREGGIHSLVHAASPPLTETTFRRTEWDSFLAHWETAVHAAYLLVRGSHALKTEAHLDSVVFVLSSVTLGKPPARSSPYVTAKFALLGLARCLAVELAPKGIRVNCVSPGFAKTSLTAHVDERIVDLISRANPMQRLCTPEDVAGAVAFLVSQESSYLTGVNLPVCGGEGMG